MPEVKQHVRRLKLFPSAKDSAEWNQVDAAVRATSFFSACVEDERVLRGLQGMVQAAMEEGMSMQEFVTEALNMLDFIRLEAPEGEEEKKVFKYSIDTLYSPERLRLIYRTQEQLAHGYAAFCEAYEKDWLDEFPAWEFVRQPGAKEDQKRPDHVAHEGDIRLKTDIQYWLDRNSFDQGGFGNPYGPWGYNSWMRTYDVDRETCELLGLLKPGERVKPPKELANWNLPGLLQQLGTAGMAELDAVQADSIAERCKEVGVPVQRVKMQGYEQLQVDMNADGVLGDLTKQTFEQWLDEDLSDLFELDD